MKALWNQPAFRVGLMLGVFAIVATTLVAFTEESTREQIRENERQALLEAINVLVPKQEYDNNILSDTLVLPPTPQLGTEEPTVVYRARKNGHPVAAVLTAVAPDGYSGSIKILIAIYTDGTLVGGLSAIRKHLVSAIKLMCNVMTGSCNLPDYHWNHRMNHVGKLKKMAVSLINLPVRRLLHVP